MILKILLYSATSREGKGNCQHPTPNIKEKENLKKFMTSEVWHSLSEA